MKLFEYKCDASDTAVSVVCLHTLTPCWFNVNEVVGRTGQIG